jgi:glutathione reductase (NADPH)
MSTYDYDLFTIGAGSGGVRASRVASSLGAKVGIAEEYRVGGTCVVRGCIPKKLFVYASQFAEEFEDAKGFGWSASGSSFDWKTLIANKDTEIDRLNGIYIKNLKASGAQIIDSRAVLKDAHTVHLAQENRDVTAKTILVAVGAWPSFGDDIPGIEHAISSNEAFHLEELPKSIVINGGGYIAVEFAGIFNGLGVETTLVYRREEILRGFDDDLRAQLHIEMERKGIRIITQNTIDAITEKDGAFAVSLSGGETLVAAKVMYATGRRPKTEGLGLEEAGVEMDKGGAIVVDGFSKSSVDNIYAVGDVTNRANLTPVAIREGAAFAQTVFNDNPVAVDHDLIPSAVFSQPEIGTVGLTQGEAEEKGHELEIHKSTFRPMKNTLSGSQEQTLMKVIVDKSSNKVLGVHILGHGAGEMIQCLGIAIKMGATKDDFDATLAVHPTAAEELVTMNPNWVS